PRVCKGTFSSQRRFEGANLGADRRGANRARVAGDFSPAGARGRGPPRNRAIGLPVNLGSWSCLKALVEEAKNSVERSGTVTTPHRRPGIRSRTKLPEAIQRLEW